MSLPKQLPPQPTPGLRNLAPMRESRPMPAMTSGPSAPTRSQMLAISLAKPIFMARNALAAYLIISALVRKWPAAARRSWKTGAERRAAA